MAAHFCIIVLQPTPAYLLLVMLVATGCPTAYCSQGYTTCIVY